MPLDQNPNNRSVLGHHRQKLKAWKREPTCGTGTVAYYCTCQHVHNGGYSPAGVANTRWLRCL